MSRWCVTAVAVWLLWPVAPADGAPKAATAGAMEEAVLKALAEGKRNWLAALVEDVKDLPVEQRKQMAFRLRSDAVEFRFRGEYPADKVSLDGLEYVASKAGEKDYESMLDVGPDELKRLLKLGAAVKQFGKGKRVPMEVRMAWVEDGRPRVEALGDILRLEPRQKEFLADLNFNEFGLLAFNAKADPAALPAKRVPAEVTVTIKLQ
jgi:hypothetical protein